MSGGPGDALTSGGDVCTSPHYTLVGALSEGPAQNISMSSAHYTAVAGIVGTTQ